MFAFVKPADFEFSQEGTKVGRTAGEVAPLEGQLSSAWTSDLIYAHIYAHTFIAAA